jgi:DnaJ-class molecular chaperone
MHHPGMPQGMHPGFFHQQMQKPPAIIKTCEITMEQCFNGCAIPLEVERWSNENGSRIVRRENMHINIPPGLDESEIIVLRDMGNSVDGQTRGDIKLSVSVKPHPLFERHGMDILYKKTLTLKEALCGFSFEIPHLNGKTLSINNTTNVTVISPNFRRTVPQMGIRRENVVGSLIIDFQVDFPKTLTAEQIEQLKEIL